MMATDCPIWTLSVTKKGTSRCGLSCVNSSAWRALVVGRHTSSYRSSFSASAIRTLKEQEEVGAPYRIRLDMAAAVQGISWAWGWSAEVPCDTPVHKAPYVGAGQLLHSFRALINWEGYSSKAALEAAPLSPSQVPPEVPFAGSEALL